MIRIPRNAAKWALIVVGALPAFWLGFHQFGVDKKSETKASLEPAAPGDSVVIERSKISEDSVVEPAHGNRNRQEVPRMPSGPAQPVTKARNAAVSPGTTDISAYVAEIENEYRQALKK